MPYKVVGGDYDVQREGSIPYFLRKGSIPSFLHHGRPFAFSEDDVVILMSVFHNGITRSHYRRSWFGNGKQERTIDDVFVKSSEIAKTLLPTATEMVGKDRMVYEKATGQGTIVLVARSEIIPPKHRDYVFTFWPKNPEEFYANLVKR